MEKRVTIEDLSVSFGPESDFKTATEKSRGLYNQHGCFVAKQLFGESQFERLSRDIAKLIDIRSRKAGVDLPKRGRDDRFDKGFLELSRHDRRQTAVLYDAFQSLSPLRELAVDSRLQSLARDLMQAETLITVEPNPIRVDQPNEDQFLFLWHQDFPYAHSSKDAVVFWIPLHKVDAECGAIRVALGSHLHDVFPVKIDESLTKTRSVEIADMSVVDQFPQVDMDIERGDVVVFSNLTLHTSQSNRSSDCRWTYQVRYGNFENEESIQKDWPGSLSRGSRFDQHYPEYVVSVEESGKP